MVGVSLSLLTTSADFVPLAVPAIIVVYMELYHVRIMLRLILLYKPLLI